MRLAFNTKNEMVYVFEKMSGTNMVRTQNIVSMDSMIESEDNLQFIDTQMFKALIKKIKK